MLRRIFLLIPVAALTLFTTGCWLFPASDVEVVAISPATGLPPTYTPQTLTMGCGPRCCIYKLYYLRGGDLGWTETDIFNYVNVPPSMGLTLPEMENFLDWGAWIPSYIRLIPKSGLTDYAIADTIARTFTYSGRIAIFLTSSADHFLEQVLVAYDPNTGSGDTASAMITQIGVMDPANVGTSRRDHYIVFPTSQFFREVYEYTLGNGDRCYYALAHHEGNNAPVINEPSVLARVSGNRFNSLDEARAFAAAQDTPLNYFDYGGRLAPTDSFNILFERPEQPTIRREERVESSAKRFPDPPIYSRDAGWIPDPTPSDSLDYIRHYADTLVKAKHQLPEDADNPLELLYSLPYIQFVTTFYPAEVIGTSDEQMTDTIPGAAGKVVGVRDLMVHHYMVVLRSHDDGSIIGLQYILNDENLTDWGTRWIPRPEDEGAASAVDEPPIDIQDVVDVYSQTYPGCQARFFSSQLRTHCTRTAQPPMIQVIDVTGNEVALIDWLSGTIMNRGEDEYIHATDERFGLPSETRGGNPAGNDAAFTLHQNSPNPFNPETQISFALSKPATVKLDVYNIAGQRVKTLADMYLPAGSHVRAWHGENSSGTQCASGVYFYRLQVDGVARSRKMILIK